MKREEIKKMVKEGYAKIAKKTISSLTPMKSCCESNELVQKISKSIGYTEEELTCVPDGSNLGLGCGNPVALASLKGGEVVLDLGSGAGFDCFLAARKVGEKGKVIGVDMTQEMIEKARENAEKGNYENVEFRLGEIENIPVADNSADVILSNCVINLSPDKDKVFKEAFRVLKPGGRLIVSDIVLLRELPESIINSVEAYINCVSGAMMKNEYIQTIRSAGFHELEIMDETGFPEKCIISDPTAKAIIDETNMSIDTLHSIFNSVVSIRIKGIKM